jgi:predicted DNA-binding transcriptional regulator YafY
MPRGDQLARQWRLLHLIDRPQGVTVEDAARDLGCAVRTIWRDLGVLQKAGFPLYTDRAADGYRSVWRVTEEFKQRLPLKLTLPELAALVMSRELLAPLGGSALGPAATGAFERIVGVLSRDARKLLDEMRTHVGIRAVGARLQQPLAEHLPIIHQALHERRTLRIRHYSPQRDDETEREIDPYHLTHFDSGLYLVAWCHLREALRIFAVERMRSVAMLRRIFTVRAGFNAQAYLGKALGIVHGELVTVKVLFAKSLAPYIRERLWHPSQKMRELPDGRLEMTLHVADTLEVRRWLLGYGVLVDVLEPAGLRTALLAEAVALAARVASNRKPLSSITHRFSEPISAPGNRKLKTAVPPLPGVESRRGPVSRDTAGGSPGSKPRERPRRPQ